MAEVAPPLTTWVFECPNDHPVFDVKGWELRDEKVNQLAGFCPQKMYADLCPECGAACVPAQYNRRRFWPRRAPALEELHSACAKRHLRVSLVATVVKTFSPLRKPSKTLELTELSVVDSMKEGHPKVSTVLLSGGMTLDEAAEKLLGNLQEQDLV